MGHRPPYCQKSKRLGKSAGNLRQASRPPRGGASDDAYLGVTPEWEKEQFAKLRKGAAAATRKLLSTNFWEKAAVGMMQVITGYGDNLAAYLEEEDLPESQA